MDSPGLEPSMATQDPSSMPEVPREVTMARGAFSSLDIRVRELIKRLDPVVRPSEPRPETIKALGPDSLPIKALGPDSLPINTSVGSLLRELTQDISRLEEYVEDVTRRLEL